MMSLPPLEVIPDPDDNEMGKLVPGRRDAILHVDTGPRIASVRSFVPSSNLFDWANNLKLLLDVFYGHCGRQI